VERRALERDWVEVETPWGPVRVKRGLRDGVVLNAHPEFEDCRKVAEAAGVPLKQVMAAALAALGSGR
jgi:pyridinium-3,5-bisthiocarboxylic acid mononucleotide nickel chelatase